MTSGTNKYVGNVVIPENVAYDGETYSVTAIGNWAFSACRDLTSITIPNSVISIDSYAFSDCTGLTSISIGNSVTTIKNDAFSYCSGLEYITVDAGNPVYDSRDNCNALIETSSNALIHGCKNTIIPNSVTTIDDMAFQSCIGLTSITIPNSVTAIGAYAFQSCSGLTSITIGNSVTTIGFMAFWGCTSLISITIPNSVTTIESNAFDHCSGLTSITIPNSVTTIGYGAFYSCSALKDFYCHAESVPTANNIFENVNLSSATLHVPEASLQKYSSTAPWNEFGQIVALTESDGIERLTSEANRPATVYDLNGRRVANPRKGIYVIGGRKTVVR